MFKLCKWNKYIPQQFSKYKIGIYGNFKEMNDDTLTIKCMTVI